MGIAVLDREARKASPRGKTAERRDRVSNVDVQAKETANTRPTMIMGQRRGHDGWSKGCDGESGGR